MLTVGSLFSGIEGFGLGLERAGMRVVWHCESDPFCQRVIRKHWPDTPIYGDVRELRGCDVQPVDVLCGGFPCQDISLAGAGTGIDGTRSGLWSEFARLIGELRPRYALIENVPALLSRGLDRVLADLAACGFDAEWDCLPASAFGAPHRRDRLWLVAYPNEFGRSEGLRERAGQSQRPGARHAVRGGQYLADTNGTTRASEGSTAVALHEPEAVKRPRRRSGICREIQDADSSALEPWRVGGRIAQAGGSEWWAAEPPVGRVAHGVPDRLDQLAALGNALVPQIAEWIGRRILMAESEGRE